MKSYSYCIFFSFVFILCIFTSNTFGMDSRHVPRKKSKKKLFRNSKEEEMYRLHHGDEYSFYNEQSFKRSPAIDIKRAGRRSSTGQINVKHRKSTTNTSYSPRLTRENSQGSISLTPEKKEILTDYFNGKDVARRKSQEQLEKLNKANKSKDKQEKSEKLVNESQENSNNSIVQNNAKWLVLRASLENK